MDRDDPLDEQTTDNVTSILPGAPTALGTGRLPEDDKPQPISERQPAGETAEALIEQFMQFAAQERSTVGSVPRRASTLRYWRSSLDLLLACMQHEQIDSFERLPADIFVRAWQTRLPADEPAIIFNVRRAGLVRFHGWCREQQVPIAAVDWPAARTPPRAAPKKPTLPPPAPPAPPPPVNHAPRPAVRRPEVRMSVPAPAVQLDSDFDLPVEASNFSPAPTQPPVQRPPPSLPALPSFAAPTQPIGSGRIPNPLRLLLPASGYKLRVSRLGERGDFVFLGDFPADRVSAFGAVPPFLMSAVARPRKLYGEQTFEVRAVGPDGTEGSPSAFTIDVDGGPSMPASQVVPQPTAADPRDSRIEALQDSVSQLTQAMQRMMQQQSMPPAASPNGDGTATLLTGLLRDLVAQRSAQTVAPVQPSPAPAFGATLRETIETVRSLQSLNPPPPPAPEVDTSGLEQRLDQMQERMQTLALPPMQPTDPMLQMKMMLSQTSELAKMLGWVPANGAAAAAAPTRKTLGDSLGSLLESVTADPERWAGAVSTVVSAFGGGSGSKSTEKQQLSGLPPDLQAALDDLIAVDARSPSALLAVGIALMAALDKAPDSEAKAVVARLTALLRSQDRVQLLLLMRRLLQRLKVADRVPLAKIEALCDVLLMRVRQQFERAAAEQRERQLQADRATAAAAALRPKPTTKPRPVAPAKDILAEVPATPGRDIGTSMRTDPAAGDFCADDEGVTEDEPEDEPEDSAESEAEAPEDLDDGEQTDDDEPEPPADAPEDGAAT